MPKTVLVADDARMMRQLAVAYLRRYGCRVIEASDGRAALAAARAHRPDLILIDISMPEMDGSDVLRALRADPDTATTPTIMMTGHATKDVVLATLRLGVSGYLVKPLRRDRFDREVSRVLGPPDGRGAAD